MPGRVLLMLIAVVASFAVTGCRTAPKLTPKGKTVIAAHADGQRFTATANLYDEVDIELPAIAVPGNRWTLVANDERFLDERQPIVNQPDGKATASFLAVRAGRRLVRFAAVPPDVREATPTQIYEVIVQIE